VLKYGPLQNLKQTTKITKIIIIQVSYRTAKRHVLKHHNVALLPIQYAVQQNMYGVKPR
jgi:hypothetical protein